MQSLMKASTNNRSKPSVQSKFDSCNKIANTIIGLSLAHAFKVAKSIEADFRVSKLDGVVYQGYPPDGFQANRINVEVVQSIVSKAWIG